MVLYNVTIKVANEIVSEWESWMKNIHLNDMMATGKFLGYRMCLLENITDDDDSTTFVVQYECNSMDDYNAYINENSEAMRQDGLKRFGNQFIAFRTVMNVVASSK